VRGVALIRTSRIIVLERVTGPERRNKGVHRSGNPLPRNDAEPVDEVLCAELEGVRGIERATDPAAGSVSPALPIAPSPHTMLRGTWH